VTLPSDLYLRQGAERRLRGGHLWVYSNEVDTGRTPLGSFAAGDLVHVHSARGDLLGSAYMDPHSLICARLYAPGESRLFDEALCTQRLQSALAGRAAAFDAPFYRLAYGDSDGLPGVVVDRFGDYCVVQLNNAGAECHGAPLLSALEELLQPAGILLRGDSRERREGGLAHAAEVVSGEVPEQVQLEENGVRFLAPVHSGQKTGWFYDHRMGRAKLARRVAGKTVLDVYSYIGGWGVQAGVFGAAAVTCVDSSATALEGVLANARLNGIEDRVSVQRGSAPEVMQGMIEAGRQFDVAILDPPAFIQRRKDIKKGLTAYRRIYELGLRLLPPGGLLVAGSCSMHLTRPDMLATIAQAAVRAGCRVQVVEQSAQGADHPIHPAIPETEYLKGMFVRRL